VQFPMGNWLQQSVADAENGSFSGWTEMSGNVQNAGVQHITEFGALSWTAGVDLSTNSSNFRISPQLTVAEDTQELMAVWGEANGTQSQHGVYAQRLDNSGNRLWGSNGTAVVPLNSDYVYLDLSIAGFSEELITTYIQQLDYTNNDIYAARLDANGDYVWTGETVAVTNSGNPKSDMMVAKGLGCLFIAWTENGSIYTHCLLEDGTLGAPINALLVPSEYATIQAAIDSADDGDMILVADGTYVENINFGGKNLKLVGANQETTIIDGDNAGTVVTFENGENSTAILSGFTITNGNGSGIEGYEGRGGGVFCINSSPTLKDLTVNGNQAETSGAGLWFGYSNSQLVDLIISNNVAAGELGAGGGISINYNSDLTLTNMLVIGNEAAYGAGIELWSYSNPLLNSVTIVGNTGSYGSGLLLSGGCHSTLINSILWDNSPHEIQIGVSENQPDSVSISYSDISGGQDSILTNDNGEIIWGLGNIDANPLFCGSDSGDFTLSENSPCIGAGYFGANMGAFDVGCGPYNFSPTEFSLSEPSNNTQLTIDESNMNDGYITFSWGESSDANSDSLYYLMRAASTEIGDHGMDTNATSITVSYVDIIEDMSENNVTAAALEWTVHVTDGIDTVEADNAPFSITIDGANALRTYLEGLLPDEFALHQNYPNPFNPVTTLRYDLAEDAVVNIIIHDMLGRQVKTLINRTQDAGYKSVNWNATNDYGKPVSAGIYLYQIQAGEYISTKKMVLLK